MKEVWPLHCQSEVLPLYISREVAGKKAMLLSWLVLMQGGVAFVSQ